MPFGGAHASVRCVRNVGLGATLAHGAAAHSARLEALGHQAARKGSRLWAPLRAARCNVPLRSACWSLELLLLLLPLLLLGRRVHGQWACLCAVVGPSGGRPSAAKFKPTFNLIGASSTPLHPGRDASETGTRSQPHAGAPLPFPFPLRRHLPHVLFLCLVPVFATRLIFVFAHHSHMLATTATSSPTTTTWRGPTLVTLRPLRDFAGVSAAH